MGYNNNNYYGRKPYNQLETLPYKKLTNMNYVDLAEEVIKQIKEIRNPSEIITTTKLRSILSLNSEIYNMAVRSQSEKLSDETAAKIQYLRVKIVYEMGREKSVKIFCENAHLLDCINDIGGTKSNYILFARYLEALVAFRKYLIGRDS